ncbi:hypothetical protein VFPFJ_09785 [Purpureocillium lilacinum]|uniref:C2H2-type domain-containing protein n=1 Tax=Purpureocillium lilacinum TaxID=33203 RepID=A0A179GVI9_PURLI|nr:hypothetical protein VFPFJ_09785 [Purpureocillium lilacinum]OAQ81330.1 hypothetical protein VFPFJ_09785 [Purpureocillium lilacinum]
MNTRSLQSTQNLSQKAAFQISGGMTHSQQPAVPVINHRSAYLNNLWDSSRGLKDPTRHHRVAPGGQTYQADQYAGVQIHAARASVQVQQPAPDFTHGASVPQEYTIIGQQANVRYGNTDCGNLGDQPCDCWEPWMGSQEEGCQISVPRPENESVLHTRGPGRFSVSSIPDGNNKTCPHCSKPFQGFTDFLFHMVESHPDVSPKDTNLSCTQSSCTHLPPFRNMEERLSHERVAHGMGF